MKPINDTVRFEFVMSFLYGRKWFDLMPLIAPMEKDAEGSLYYSEKIIHETTFLSHLDAAIARWEEKAAV